MSKLNRRQLRKLIREAYSSILNEDVGSDEELGEYVDSPDALKTVNKTRLAAVLKKISNREKNKNGNTFLEPSMLDKFTNLTSNLIKAISKPLPEKHNEASLVALAKKTALYLIGVSGSGLFSSQNIDGATRAGLEEECKKIANSSVKSLEALGNIGLTNTLIVAGADGYEMEVELLKALRGA